MKLHLKISILALLLISQQFFSQGMGLNHRKYWWYKSRLNNDFVKVGLGDGESLLLSWLLRLYIFRYKSLFNLINDCNVCCFCYFNYKNYT